MNLFGKKTGNEIKKLIKEREKKDKEIEKKWGQRANLKYSQENLKTARKTMETEAMKIDSLEYEKITKELKERLEKTKNMN